MLISTIPDPEEEKRYRNLYNSPGLKITNMPTDFAFPIMHNISSNYLPFTDKFLPGTTFFQPIESLKVKDRYPTGGPPEIATHLNDPISRFYAPGIEMFFDGVDGEVKL